jgi:hypothetical protein
MKLKKLIPYRAPRPALPVLSWHNLFARLLQSRPALPEIPHPLAHASCILWPTLGLFPR